MTCACELRDEMKKRKLAQSVLIYSVLILGLSMNELLRYFGCFMPTQWHWTRTFLPVHPSMTEEAISTIVKPPKILDAIPFLPPTAIPIPARASKAALLHAWGPNMQAVSAITPPSLHQRRVCRQPGELHDLPCTRGVVILHAP